MTTSVPQSRPGPQPEVTRPAGPAARVLAFIDQRDCSIAAVRRGAELAAAHAVPLEVVFLQTHPSPLLAANPMGMMAVGAVIELEDKLEIELFADVARIVAPHGLSWKFAALPYYAARSVVGDTATEHTLVVARHFRRPVAGRLLAAVRAAGDAGRPARLHVVGCDHRPDGSVAATASPILPGGPR
jgi:hypothetical protein